MHSFTRIILCMLASMLPLAPTMAAPAALPSTLYVVADLWCPYNCLPDSEHEGYMVDILHEVFTPLGVRVKYSLLPWSRSVSMARQGTFHAIVGASHEDAPDFIFPETALGRAEMHYFVPTVSQWRYKGAESLSAVTLGVIRDYAYSPSLDSYIYENRNNNELVQFVSGEDALGLNIKKLMQGRVSAVPEEASVMAYYLMKTNQNGMVMSAGVAPLEANKTAKAVYVAFTPGQSSSDLLAKTLSEGITTLRASGKLSEILARYGLRDWESTPR